MLSKEFPRLGLEVLDIRLGEVVLKDSNPSPVDEETIKAMLLKNGFDLLYTKNHHLIEQIKMAVEKGVQKQLDTGEPVKFSVLISDELHKEYDSVSSLFSSFEGYTLEKYIISRKIEKVKEFLVYTDRSLSDIAYALGYNSPAYLSNQLKKHTGFTSSYFKRIRRDKLNVITEANRKSNLQNRR